MNMTATGVLFRKALMTATSRKVKKMVVRGRVEPRSATYRAAPSRAPVWNMP